MAKREVVNLSSIGSKKRSLKSEKDKSAYEKDKSAYKKEIITIFLGSSIFFVVCAIIFAVIFYTLHFFTNAILGLIFRIVLFLIGGLVYLILISELIKVYKLKHPYLE